MESTPARRLIALLTLFGLFAIGCGGKADVTTESGDFTIDLEDQFSEQDLELARVAFDMSKETWEAHDPFAYTFSAGVDTINLIEIDFDEEGNASPERVVMGEADPGGWATVPRSVDDAFAQIDALILAFESGELDVPGPDDCGWHFNIQFDPDLGSPRYFDTLGPCDDGVGMRMHVTPAGEAGPELTMAPVECDSLSLVGTWVSPRAAGAEPLEPDAGIADEGGAGVVALTLVDGAESTLMSADTIEIIGEWFCVDSVLIGLSGQGEEFEIATVNDDGTLTYKGLILTRDDG